MEYTITDIEYDTDGENVDLPNELKFEVPNELMGFDIEDFISDEISKITGFCHNGFAAIPSNKVKVNYISDVMQMAQIDEDAILHEVVLKMKGKEDFKDTNIEINDKIYTGDIFNKILEENNNLSTKAINYLNDIIEQVKEYHYIQVVYSK